MEPSVWKLEDRWAKLRLARLTAAIDLSEPARGLHELWVEERPWQAARLLEVGIGGTRASQLEAYVRGTDLVATYEQTETRSFRAQAYWRARPGSTTDIPAVLDLVLSVQTSLLDSDPGLNVGSVVPGSECFRLVRLEEPLYERVPLSFSQHSGEGHDGSMTKSVLVEAITGTGCFLVRAPKSHLTYVEMVHPVDFIASNVCVEPEGHCQLRHRLFVRRLEKGVILRARVRSALVPREHDMLAATTLYREFAAAEPPLTT